jgi:hypothetical protein
MIRITTDSSNGLRLVVEGHLSGPAVDELRKSCAGRHARTVLDLSGVVFADRSAALLLNELSAAGFVLEACSGFIKQLLLENPGGIVR